MAGRPPYYNTPEELESGVVSYFEFIQGELVEVTDDKGQKAKEWRRLPEPATITGLALYLGFTDRQSLYDYQEKPEFTCIVKKARTMVECEYEKRLAAQSPTGAIFALKNMGWKDKSEVEQSGGIKLTGININWPDGN